MTEGVFGFGENDTVLEDDVDGEEYEDDGPGFCFEAIPDITLKRGGCGPLDVALDTSVLINYCHFGSAMLEGELDPDNPGVDEDVRALGEILHLWMYRAIRFYLSPLNVEDAKRRLSDERRAEREDALWSLMAAITCHNGTRQDWSTKSETASEELDLGFPPPLTSTIASLPKGYDRRLVREALTQKRHIFLTCDKRLVNSASGLRNAGLLVVRPTQLVELFNQYEIGQMSGGTRPHNDCPYEVWMFADTHKWLHLAQAFSLW